MTDSGEPMPQFGDTHDNMFPFDELVDDPVLAHARGEITTIQLDVILEMRVALGRIASVDDMFPPDDGQGAELPQPPSNPDDDDFMPPVIFVEAGLFMGYLDECIALRREADELVISGS